VAEDLFVLAGANGAGKSSIGGAFLRSIGREYFNPDEVARNLRDLEVGLTIEEANSAAWQLNARALTEAIDSGKSYAFESTLGGRTIPSLLKKAANVGFRLHIWYCGLSSPELHLERISKRVLRGGHDIPEIKVRERYRSSQHNLISLMPLCFRVEVFDNSTDVDATGHFHPSLVLRVQAGCIDYPSTRREFAATPGWAEPIVARAFEVFSSRLIG